MCEFVLSVPSLKSGFFYKNLSLTNLGRIGNPPTGDYRVVLTLSELNEGRNHELKSRVFSLCKNNITARN